MTNGNGTDVGRRRSLLCIGVTSLVLVAAPAATAREEGPTAATLLSPAPGSVVSAQFEYRWTLPSNENAARWRLATSPDTDSDGRLLQENVIWEEALAPSGKQTRFCCPVGPAGHYWWQIETDSNGYLPYIESRPVEFEIAKFAVFRSAVCCNGNGTLTHPRMPPLRFDGFRGLTGDYQTSVVADAVFVATVRVENRVILRKRVVQTRGKAPNLGVEASVEFPGVRQCYLVTARGRILTEEQASHVDLNKVIPPHRYVITATIGTGGVHGSTSITYRCGRGGRTPRHG